MALKGMDVVIVPILINKAAVQIEKLFQEGCLDMMMMGLTRYCVSEYNGMTEEESISSLSKDTSEFNSFITDYAKVNNIAGGKFLFFMLTSVKMEIEIMNMMQREQLDYGQAVERLTEIAQNNLNRMKDGN